MLYDELPLSHKAEMMRVCIKNGITSPEDIRTAYNNYVEGRNIFDGLSESYRRVAAFNKFLAGGKTNNKYSGEDEPTGKMTMRVNQNTVKPVSVSHSSSGYTYNLPELVVTPQANPDDGYRRRVPLYEIQQQKEMNKTINEGMNKAGKVGAAAMAAGMAPYLMGTVASAAPYISKGIGAAVKAMNPSSYTGIFGTGTYTTALGGTGTSLAGALADNALASYYGAEAGKALVDNWGSNSVLGNGANAVYAGLAALPMIPIPKDSELLKRIASGAVKQKELEAHMSKGQATKLVKLSKEPFLTMDQRSERSELLRKYLLKSKGKKGVNDGIEMVRSAQERERAIADPQVAAEKAYRALTNSNEAGVLEDLYQQTRLDYGAPVKWNWYDQGILAEKNIPPRVAVSKALINGVEDTEPIMKRFLQNVSDKDGVIQTTFKKLVDDGVIGVNDSKQWVLASSGERVDPTRYTLNYIMENELKSTNRIPYIEKVDNGERHTLIPWHGTNIADETLINAYNNPTGRPLFTTIDDGSKGFNSVKDAYGTGASLPVMRKSPSFELAPLKANGLSHNSNNYGEVGELMDYFNRLPGKAQEVKGVSDVANIKGNTGQRQNEYNYGVGTPDVKFLFNTFNLKGEKGAFTNAEGGYLTIKKKRHDRK